MATRPPLLFIFGAGDQSDQVRHSGFRTHLTGSTDLGRLLPEDVVRHRLVVTPDFFRGPSPDLSAYPVIANMITEPEHSAGLLRDVQEILSAVPGRIVNPPAAVLRSRRDQVAELLADIDGLIVPRTFRFAPDEREEAATRMADVGKVILRQAGTHGGTIIGLFESFAEALEAAEPGRVHIATEFVDFRSADGLYRKFRVFFIGRHRILRHMLISQSWSVHGADRADFMAPRPNLIAEERAIFESVRPFPPEVTAVFDAVRQRMPLDFFGLDFGLGLDGRVVLFEANATMSFMSNLFVEQFEYLQRCYLPGRAAFMELLGLTDQRLST